jgi:tripartite-type tricarboxylate transporter receptor subunit TctC
MTGGTVSRRAALLALGSTLAAPAIAQTKYPSRPVKLIVNFGAGGAADTVARLMQARFQESLGQPLVIENRPGAGGTIGAISVARSDPDGYTVLFDSPGHIIGPLLQPGITINYETAFSYISGCTIQPWVWMVSEKFPANDLQGFIAESKKRGKPVIFGSSGIGSAGHLTGELLGQRTGLAVEHLPYRSGAEAGNDVAAGNLETACITVSSAAPAVKLGKGKYIASTGAKRSVALPDLPTFAESGLPGFDVTSWVGLFGPAGLPPEVVTRLNAAAAFALADNEVRERLMAAGFEPAPSSPQQFTEKIAQERATLTPMVKSWQAKEKR